MSRHTHILCCWFIYLTTESLFVTFHSFVVRKLFFYIYIDNSVRRCCFSCGFFLDLLRAAGSHTPKSRVKEKRQLSTLRLSTRFMARCFSELRSFELRLVCTLNTPSSRTCTVYCTTHHQVNNTHYNIKLSMKHTWT